MKQIDKTCDESGAKFMNNIFLSLQALSHVIKTESLEAVKMSVFHKDIYFIHA